IPDDNNDQFISSKAYELDIGQLHPFNGPKWDSAESRAFSMATLKGKNHILIVDADEKRSRLIKTVVTKMGYTATLSKNGIDALNSFKIQPEKFRMIITHHQIPGMKSEEFIKKIIKINHKIPVVVETGYRNTKVQNRFATQFEGTSSVTIKPVVLRDLRNTIQKLIKNNA
ncbi:MAG: response regulator, partial [Desulfobacteraceae bacterium]|nr:response regulator [Desulfobacteraceae bacterium]